MKLRLDRRAALASTAAFGAVGAFGFARPARAATSLEMILNWRYQGPQAWFFLAQDKGYFADAGLEITMDQGNGSGAAVGQVAGGAYDIGFGDINALIRLAADKPDEAPIGIFQMYNQPPFTVAVRQDSDIHDAKDLEGKLLGGAANDGALKLWPAFTKIAGIDTSGIEITNFKPNLREQMLRNAQVDGVFGYVNTIRFSAKLSGMNPEEQIRFIRYGDYGMDLYSNGIIVSKQLAQAHPEAMPAICAGINQGVADTLADLDNAIDAVAAREPLIDPAIEKERLLATIRDEMGHPELARVGLGNVDQERFARAIDIVVDAFDLARTPSPEEVFSSEFLPPADERLTALL